MSLKWMGAGGKFRRPMDLYAKGRQGKESPAKNKFTRGCECGNPRKLGYTIRDDTKKVQKLTHRYAIGPDDVITRQHEYTGQLQGTGATYA